MTEIVITNDYNGYFERLVRKMIEQHPPKQVKKITVMATPFKEDALEIWRGKPGEVVFDFYSALHAGFGQLSKQDEARAIEFADQICG